MPTLEKLTDRILALLGVDLDLSLGPVRDRFDAIAGDLYLGARPGPDQIPLLEAAGITHVVSCLREEDRSATAFLADGFERLFIPVHDGVHEDIASTFPAFFDFVSGARRRQARAKVLVHCEVGVSRSATLVTALMMRRLRGRFFETFCEVRRKRGGILPNIGFASQLQRLELDMHPAARDDPGPSSLARYLTRVCAVPVEIETLDDMLRSHDYDAFRAIEAIFGSEIPRVIQGVRF